MIKISPEFAPENLREKIQQLASEYQNFVANDNLTSSPAQQIAEKLVEMIQTVSPDDVDSFFGLYLREANKFAKGPADKEIIKSAQETAYVWLYHPDIFETYKKKVAEAEKEIDEAVDSEGEE